MYVRITLDDLRKAHGVLTTNGALLHLPQGYGRGMAVYPIQALLNHSCMYDTILKVKTIHNDFKPQRCNTTSQDYPQEQKVEIKARFKISSGDQITTSYIRPTQAGT